MYYAGTEPGKDDMPGKHLWFNALQALYDFHNEIGEQTHVALEHTLMSSRPAPAGRQGS